MAVAWVSASAIFHRSPASEEWRIHGVAAIAHSPTGVPFTATRRSPGDGRNATGPGATSATKYPPSSP